MSRASELDWLLDDLVTRVVHIRKAVILSRDGLPIGSSAGLSQEDADHLCAAAAGLRAWPGGSASTSGAGTTRQTIVEMESEFLFVTAAGEGSCLAVLADGRGRRRPHRLRDGTPGQAGRGALSVGRPARPPEAETK